MNPLYKLELKLFPCLPTELSQEVIRIAAAPIVESWCAQKPEPHVCYATALSLVQVSRQFHAEVMPILLHNVVLRSRENLKAFIRFALEARQHKTHHLWVVDYIAKICRVRCTEIYENLDMMATEECLGYEGVTEVLKNVGWLGFNNSTLHLLQHAVDGGYDDTPLDWASPEAVFWGRTWWTPFTFSDGGRAYLRQLTRLTIWQEDSSSQPAQTDPRGLQTWVMKVPFSDMPNLTHFACSLGRDDIIRHGPFTTVFYTPTKMMVYIVPPCSKGQNPHIIEQWVHNPQDKHGVVVEFSAIPKYSIGHPHYATREPEGGTCMFWEEVFLHGDSDRAWREAEKQLALVSGGT
ncbi:hypothetical protein H0H81_001598 [Sphagnurus paluster]|uniref:Uncharacterized protein n=1 Tax=Sphagnurus paluster TaxID=117069 RepID=A0A9P7K5V3_9AGAR|nr:hypothetical protein H0H81_001598 [Sphagnurus paluster]